MTASTDLVTTDLRGFLQAQSGSDVDYLAIYDRIVDTVDTENRTPQITNRKARVERFKTAVTSLAKNRRSLAEVNKTFTGYLKQVRKNAALAIDEPRQLTKPEAKDLMTEALDLKQIEDFVKARWETIKEHVFTHMTEQFAEDGEEFPEHINGSVDVEELGYRFAREGAGRKDPILQEGVLHSLVGNDVWNRIVDRTTVVTEQVNVGKLMAEAHRNPAVLEDLRKALKVGEWKNPRLNVREL